MTRYLSDSDLKHRQAYMDAHDGSLDGYVPLPRKAKRKRGNEESRIQKSCRRWWDSVAASHGLDKRVLYAVPNGATLGGDSLTRQIRASILKDEGLRPKYPDMNLDVMRGGYGGLRIEMKKPGQEADEGQIEYHAVIRAQGYKVVVCHSLEGFMCAVCGYLGNNKMTGDGAQPRRSV